MSEQEIRLELERWKGYSAYEVAKQNGFNGTEKEWLESMGAAINITVNGRQVDGTGNITVTAEHIMMVEEGQISVSQKVKTLEEETDARINAVSSAADKLIPQKVTIPAASWEQDGEIYGQSVAVQGVTADADRTTVIVSPPADRAMEEEYISCEVRASAQGDGVVVFTCTDKPEVDLEANVMVVVLGTTAVEGTDVYVSGVSEE